MAATAGALAIATGGAGVAGADTRVAAAENPGPVAAYGNVVAWSEPAGEGRWRVVAAVSGAPGGAVSFTSKRSPHVSVGPDARGRPVITYERCGGRCVPYRLEPGSSRPQRIRARGARGAACNEILSPTLERHRLAFVSTGCERRGIYVRTAAGKTRRIAAGRPSPGIDIGSGHVAAVDTDPALPGHKRQGNIVLVRVSGGPRRVFDSGQAGNGYTKGGPVVNSEVAIRVSSPSIDGAFVHWLKTSSSPDGVDYEVLTARVADKRRCASRDLGDEPSGPPRSIAVAGGRLFYTTPRGVFEDTTRRFSYEEC